MFTMFFDTLFSSKAWYGPIAIGMVAAVVCGGNFTVFVAVTALAMTLRLSLGMWQLDACPRCRKRIKVGASHCPRCGNAIYE